MHTITIGRAFDNDIVIQDKAVSKKHLKITLNSQGEYLLEDLGSTNGTFVNGKLVRTCKLQPNDVVKIGNTLIPWQSYFRSVNTVGAPATGKLIQKITIGRASTNDFVIDNPAVSSLHAFLEIYDNNTYRIIDNNSTNGTFREGQRIKQAWVNRGEFVYLASVQVSINEILNKVAFGINELNNSSRSLQVELPKKVRESDLSTTKNSLTKGLLYIAGIISVILVLVFSLQSKKKLENNSQENDYSNTLPKKDSNNIPITTEKEDQQSKNKNLLPEQETKPNKPELFPPPQPQSDKNYQVPDLVEISENAVFMVVSLYNGVSQGFGTGFFVTNSGIGVSNYHVFSGGNEWQIKLKNGKIYRVNHVIKEDANLDYIIFQTEAQETNSLPVAMEAPRKGEDVIVIGNPQGFELSVTKGVVSGLRDYDKATGIASNGDTYVQIDAAISSGNSGGPVLNMKGEVIGIATMVHHASSGVSQNINLALNIQKVPLPR